MITQNASDCGGRKTYEANSGWAIMTPWGVDNLNQDNDFIVGSLESMLDNNSVA